MMDFLKALVITALSGWALVATLTQGAPALAVVCSVVVLYLSGLLMGMAVTIWADKR